MKIVVDMNLAPQWVEVLRRDGFDADHWSQIGDPRATDQTIMDWARNNNHVVFTHEARLRNGARANTSEGPKRGASAGAGRSAVSDRISFAAGAATVRNAVGGWRDCCCGTSPLARTFASDPVEDMQPATRIPSPAARVGAGRLNSNMLSLNLGLKRGALPRTCDGHRGTV